MIGTIAAQETERAELNAWFGLINHVRFHDKWQFSMETRERFGDFLQTQGSFILRPSIDYSLNKNVIFSTGYTFVHTSPHEPYSLQIPRNESNVWEQVKLKFNIGEFRFQNRLREENRWLDHIELKDSAFAINGMDFKNRLRFRMTISRDLYKFKNGQKIFFSIYDEVWFSQDNFLIPKSFIRNWTYLGLGYNIKSNMALHMGYMNQWDKVGTDHVIISPILRTIFIWNFDLKKDK